MNLEELLKVLDFPVEVEVVVRDVDTGLRTDALSVLTKRVKLVYQEVGKQGVQPTLFIDVEEKSPCNSST